MASKKLRQRYESAREATAKIERAKRAALEVGRACEGLSAVAWLDSYGALVALHRRAVDEMGRAYETWRLAAEKEAA